MDLFAGGRQTTGRGRPVRPLLVIAGVAAATSLLVLSGPASQLGASP